MFKPAPDRPPDRPTTDRPAGRPTCRQMSSRIARTKATPTTAAAYNFHQGRALAIVIVLEFVIVIVLLFVAVQCLSY